MMHPSFQECTWINLHAISRVNLPSTFLRGGTPFGLNPLQAPTPVEKNKQQQATREPEEKEKHFRDEKPSNYVLALRTMQQDKTDKQQTLPKQTNMKDNCYKVDG